jgi:glycosyltransferase involved in cell wall biosynthesis
MTDQKNRLIFLQNRATRAGAQVSLSRILGCTKTQSLQPHAILGTTGWLDNYLDEISISHTVAPWPSPRSLTARLGGLKRYARQLITHLKSQDIRSIAIVANDYQECLLAHAMADATGGAPVIGILRTPGMSLEDFRKYRCHECQHLFARGEELTKKVKNWCDVNITCMLGSFSNEDLYPPLTPPDLFPKNILVAGSEEPRKGFTDLIKAITILEQTEPDFPAVKFTLTGDKTDFIINAISQNLRSSFEFVGRVTDFSDFARQFQLAIHPSRSESFGMAPLELVLAGLPTMMSRSGIVPTLPITAPWTFFGNNPPELAKCLSEIWTNWPKNLPNTEQLQQHILTNHPIQATTESLVNTVKKLCEKQ